MAYPTQGLMNGMVGPDDTPDTKKSAGDLFQELGIFSPSEKLQNAQRQQLAIQMYQQQQDQARRQQAIQAAQIGTGFGFPVFTAMGGMNQSRPPQMQNPQGGDSFDPGSVISQELAASPDDRAGAMKRAGMKLMQIGSQKGDSTLQRIASNLIIKSQQEGVVQQKAMAEKAESDRKAAQAGNPGDTYTYRKPNGDIVTGRQNKNALGGFTGDEVLGEGPNKQITTTVDDPRTQTQKGEEYLSFQKLLTNTRGAVDSMRDIATNLEQGAAQGWAAKGVTLMDNVVGTLQQYRPDATYTAKAQAAIADLKSSGTFDKWAQKTGVNQATWNDLVSNLAKTYNPTGTITEKDIDRAAKAVGANFSNPKTVAAVLRDAERRALRTVSNTYEDMGDDARSASQPQMDRFMGKYGAKRKVVQRGKRANGTPVVRYDDGKVEDDPDSNPDDTREAQ